MSKLPAKLDERQLKFLDILFHPDVKGDLETAKAVAGWDKDVPIHSILTKEFTKAINERTDAYLASLTPMAAQKILEVMGSPNKPGNQQLLRAAETVLDRQGLGKKEVTQGGNNKVQAIIVIPQKQMIEELPESQMITINGADYVKEGR